MTIRTFIQNGQAYGSAPVTVQTKIDGVIVLDAEVPTLDQPLPILPTENLQRTGNILYSWENDVEFSGTRSLEISVSGPLNGMVLLTDSWANYPDMPKIEDPANTWGTYYSYVDSAAGNLLCSDPLTDETINGVVQPHTPMAPLTGQWYWQLPVGSTFTATINIQAGNVGNV